MHPLYDSFKKIYGANSAKLLLEGKQEEHHFVKLFNGMVKKPHTATELMTIIEDWLNQDDATNWGTFEGKLHNLIESERKFMRNLKGLQNERI